MIIFPSCPHNNSLSVFAIKIGKIVIRLIILQCIPFNYNKLSYVQKVMLKSVSIAWCDDEFQCGFGEHLKATSVDVGFVFCRK